MFNQSFFQPRSIDNRYTTLYLVRVCIEELGVEVGSDLSREALGLIWAWFEVLSDSLLGPDPRLVTSYAVFLGGCSLFSSKACLSETHLMGFLMESTKGL